MDKPDNDNTKDGKNWEHGNPLAVKWRLGADSAARLSHPCNCLTH